MSTNVYPTQEEDRAGGVRIMKKGARGWRCVSEILRLYDTVVKVLRALAEQQSVSVCSVQKVESVSLTLKRPLPDLPVAQ